ncbi:MAG TPA: hypothetical protein VHG72_21525 [Polyangia bacterium]|nr:hypothetical protein [Polyangia bacterium]
MQSRRTLRVFWPALAFAPLLACGPSVPASPSYEADVLPIFRAHCLRCHGDANPDAGPYNTTQTANLVGLATVNLTSYAQTVSWAQMKTATGQGVLSDVIHGGKATAQPMPLPPAAPLDDYELKVMDAWISNPVCSHDANPDPAICPADGGT